MANGVPINSIDSGYIKKWLVLGPFPEDLNQDFLGGEANVFPKEGDVVPVVAGPMMAGAAPPNLTWRRFESPDHVVNLINALGVAQHVTAYAFCLLQSPIDVIDLPFALGSDDKIKVWINRVEVHKFDRDRSFTLDEDNFKVELHAGENPCLVKVTQGIGEWKFSLKAKVDITGTLIYETASVIAGQTGKQPLPGVKVSLTTPGQVLDTSSGSDGKFILTGVTPGDWMVDLPKEIPPGAGLPRLRLGEPGLASFQIAFNAGLPVNLGEIAYTASGGFVQGNIFFDDEDPPTGKLDNHPRLAMVKVSLVNLNTGKISTTETDSQGRYYFDNPEPSIYSLKFEPTLDAAKHGLGEGALGLPDNLPGTFFVGSDDEKTQDLGYVAVESAVQGIVFLDKDANRSRFGNEPGIPDVPIVLVNQHGKVKRAVTDPAGGYNIKAPAGNYKLQFTKVFVYDKKVVNAIKSNYGDEFVLTTDETQLITLKAGETVEVKPTGYQPEVHEIRGKVVFEDDTPVAGLVVILKDAAGTQDIDTALTDEKGLYVFKDHEGDFKVAFPPDPFQGQLLTRSTIEVHSESITILPTTKYRLTSSDGAGVLFGGVSGPGSLQESVADIATYMPTSQEVLGPAGRPAGRGYGSSSGYAPLQQIIDDALTSVLGRRLKKDDPKAFALSLERSFTAYQIESRTEYKWTPRTYAVQTELGGGISGAQASIYHRAKVALDDALPLLDGLEPLLPNFDEQEVNAVRAIVQKQLTELVNELGVEGGPTLQRVDDLFRLLRRKLDDLKEVFGLKPENIVTVQEEQDLTNFLVIQDYVEGLFAAWIAPQGYRAQFAGSDSKITKALGTQLVLLSRALSVIAESVNEVYLQMDSVLLGPAERQTVTIIFPKTIRLNNATEYILKDPQLKSQPMLISELLGWVERFATDEGPTLVQEGGKRGVAVIQPTADRLQRLVLGASQPNSVAHIGFNRTRVRRALNELALQLGQVERLSRELLREDELIP